MKTEEEGGAMIPPLKKREDEGEPHGLKLNKDKCEAIPSQGTTRIKFADGKLVKQVTETKYLGCELNDKANVQREADRRLSEVYETWKQIKPYSRNGSIPCKEKLRVYDMIVRIKLFYGLDTAQINYSVFISRMYPFYRKKAKGYY